MTVSAAPLPETAPVYLYAVVAADCEDPMPPLRLIRRGDLAVAISPPPSPFVELAAQLKEGGTAGEGLSHLEEALMAHEGAIEGLRSSSVAPLRFGTTVASSADVALLLELNADSLRHSLARVAGRAEWSVRVFTEEPAPAGPPEEPSAPRSGRAYLERRRRERSLVDEERHRREEAAAAIESRLQDAGAELAVLPESARDREVEGRSLLLACVCLAPREAEERLVAALEEAVKATGDARAELTGPWPPYHFVSALRLDDQGGPLL